MPDIGKIETFEGFESDVEEKLIAVMLFTSANCHHCDGAHQILDLLSNQYDCFIVDALKSRDLCHMFSVEEVPTVIVLKKGRMVKHVSGNESINVTDLVNVILTNSV